MYNLPFFPHHCTRIFVFVWKHQKSRRLIGPLHLFKQLLGIHMAYGYVKGDFFLQTVNSCPFLSRKDMTTYRKRRICIIIMQAYTYFSGPNFNIKPDVTSAVSGTSAYFEFRELPLITANYSAGLSKNNYNWSPSQNLFSCNLVALKYERYCVMIMLYLTLH